MQNSVLEKLESSTAELLKELSVNSRTYNKINDGDFHIHYPNIASDERILSQLDRVRKIKEKNNIDKIAGIFTFNNVGIMNEIRENHSYVYPGVYVSLDRYINEEDREEELLKRFKNNYNFVKIHHWLGFPYLMPEVLKKVVDDSVSLGIKKFSIHTETLDNEKLDILDEHIRKHDAIFYLVHGLNAVYGYFRRPSIERLKGMEGNLLFGTSSHSGIILLPNNNVKKALDDNLENMIVFESDFALHYEDDRYPYNIQSVTGAVGNNEKILHDNLKLFLK